MALMNPYKKGGVIGELRSPKGIYKDVKK